MTGSDLLRALDRATAHPSWMAFGAFVLVAAIQASRSAPPPSPAPASEASRRELFSAVASMEPTFRARAETHFPGDAWSQDDDFHAMETQLAQRQAAARGMSPGDALRAIDEGMRDKWPLPPNVKLRNTVPPCRPRPVY